MQQKSMAQRAEKNLSHVEKRIFKVLGSMVLIKPIQKTLRIREIINSYCSDGSEITHGQVIEILTTNRLMAPKPLYHVEKWAKDVAVKEVYGVIPEKLNDDRLGRSLDAIYPHLENIWDQILTEAILNYDIDISSSIRDMTSFYFEGEYEESKIIELGYSRDEKPDKVQANLEVNVTAKENIPFSYKLLSGSTADGATILENMERLKKLKDSLPKKEEKPLLIIGDGKCISEEIVPKYHQKGIYYLAPLQITKERRDLVSSIPEEEFDKNKLQYKRKKTDAYFGVMRTISFEDKGKIYEDKALIVKSKTKLSRDRKNREKAIQRREEKLKGILSQLNKRKYKKKSYVEKMIEKALSGSRAKKYFEVSLAGEDGNLKLDWGLNEKAIEEDKKLDGKYILATSYSFKSADDMLISYKKRDKVEKRISHFKGPLRIRPLFLEGDERIASLVFVVMLSLLIYSIIEMLCRRSGFPKITTRTVLFYFEHLLILTSIFSDNSRLTVTESLSDTQRTILKALFFPDPESYIDPLG